ncbi:MAG: DUF1624 domain-containing protein [Bacteroidia bacterium]
MTDLNAQGRLQSLDILRGLVMIIMALDHVRDYFHQSAFLFDPTNLDQSDSFSFFTRWITHFCAPVFVFLAGSSAWLYGRKYGLSALRRFLLSRGIWLIFLELTVVNFAWYFNPAFNSQMLGVIWVIGLTMLLLAALINLPLRFVLILGFLLVFGHNLLDGIAIQGQGAASVIWAILHQMAWFDFGSFSLFVAYPILPWFGVMLLGFGAGSLFANKFPADLRKRWLSNAAYFALLLFVILRLADLYGDPLPWTLYDNKLYNLLSFVNTTKYPPSLLFILMTLGPALWLLNRFEQKPPSGFIARALSTIGRVPLFFYVVHIYFIHLLALLAAELTGYGWESMRLDVWVNYAEQLQGYGFSLGVTYLVWIGVVVALFPVCVWWAKMKKQYAHRWWMQYL